MCTSNHINVLEKIKRSSVAEQPHYVLL